MSSSVLELSNILMFVLYNFLHTHRIAGGLQIIVKDDDLNSCKSGRDVVWLGQGQAEIKCSCWCTHFGVLIEYIVVKIEWWIRCAMHLCWRANALTLTLILLTCSVFLVSSCNHNNTNYDKQGYRENLIKHFQTL